MLHRRLEELERKGTPIRIGIVGCGRMGAGVINQIAQCQGMRIVAAADMRRDHAEKVVRESGRKTAVCVTDDLATATSAIARGETVVSGNGRLIPQLPVDVVMEATGIPESGARIAYDAILQRKHVVTLNVEADAVVGPILTRLANNAGVLYSVILGDEPGTLGNMYEWAVSIGLEVVVAAKGPMRPIDWNANPDSVGAEAAKLGLNPKILASFRDGSKHCVEMCVVSNGTGLVPDVRGTHAQPMSLDEIPRKMRLKKDGGILSRTGVVEMTPPVLKPDGTVDSDRSVAPGVYLVVTSPHPQIRADFKYLLLGDGPYYVLHRPYHLCAIEAPYTVARVVLHGDVTLNCIGAPVSEVVTIAKSNLLAGEQIEGSGGAQITGQIDKHEICRSENLLPLGLSYDVFLKRDVAKGKALTFDDVALADDLFIYQLWRMQQMTLG